MLFVLPQFSTAAFHRRSPSKSVTEMADFTDFDPLTSPANASQAAAASSPSTNSSPAKFTGVTEKYLHASKWHSLKNDATKSYSLTFHAPQAAAHGEDAIEKIQREKAEKEAADKKLAEETRAAEEARQQEAIAAAAAGKEAIGEDAKKVALPSPKAEAMKAPPVDPELQKAQQKLEKLTMAQQQRNRYAGKPTFQYASTEGDKVVQYEGVTTILKNTIELSDVTRTEPTGVGAASEDAKRVDVQGTFTLTVTPDGKKLSGTIANEAVEFDLYSADPTKALEQLLGL
jgi:hypothetical protein